MRISIIAAVSDNNVIGRAGDLPWHLRTDLRRFRSLTTGHTVIVGRKTHESILRRLGKPLPERRTIVLSRDRTYPANGCEVAASLADALARVRGAEEVFIIGGAEVYRMALAHADRLYLTRVHADIEGDAYFPPVDPAAWSVTSREPHSSDEENDFAHTVEVWERIPAFVTPPQR